MTQALQLAVTFAWHGKRKVSFVSRAKRILVSLFQIEEIELVDGGILLIAIVCIKLTMWLETVGCEQIP